MQFWSMLHTIQLCKVEHQYNSYLDLRLEIPHIRLLKASKPVSARLFNYILGGLARNRLFSVAVTSFN